MGGAVVYKSRYGSARQYAEWIGEKTGFEVMEAKDADAVKLAACGTIIFCGGVFAGGIEGAWFARKAAGLYKSRLAVCAAGMTPGANKDYWDNLFAKNFQGTGERIKTFALPGDVDFSKLSLIHRLILTVLAKAIGRKPIEEQGDMRGLVENVGGKVEISNKEAISPVVEWAKGV